MPRSRPGSHNVMSRPEVREKHKASMKKYRGDNHHMRDPRIRKKATETIKKTLARKRREKEISTGQIYLLEDLND